MFQFSLFSSCLFPESFLLCDFSFLDKLLHLVFKIHCKILGQKFHVTQRQHFSLIPVSFSAVSLFFPSLYFSLCISDVRVIAFSPSYLNELDFRNQLFA